MSYVVHPSARGRRVRKNEGSSARDIRGKPPKSKPKTREAPERRELVSKKIVVRNLPLNFTKELFLQHVSPLPEYTYFAFHGPDNTLANQARCRAYIRFRNEDDITVFKEKFDGYIFLDSRGHELRCSVELAPYQRVAIQHQEKADQKCGDIFNTEDYKRFLEELERKKDHVSTSNAAKVQANLAALEKSSQSESTVTPLMEFVQAQRAEEEMNYRRPLNAGSSSRKERNRERASKKSGPKEDLEPFFPTKPVLVRRREDRDRTQPAIGAGNNAPPSGVYSDSRPNSARVADKLPEKPRPNTVQTPPHPAPMVLKAVPQVPAADSAVGRHFLADRPFLSNKAVLPETAKPERPPGGTRNQPLGKTKVFQKQQTPRNAPFSEELPDGGYGAPPSRRPPKPARADQYGYPRWPEEEERKPLPPAGGGGKAGRPQPPRAPAQIENPITGVKEFLGQVRVAVAMTEKPLPSGDSVPAVESPTSAAPMPGDLLPDGSRVPNRARPAMQLYQPRGKRRYQN
ncbi:putative Regulator of nonsense transcripts 3A [Hypsibius exemplaris]|uniref:Regulator of nonsense transcripts 3A n=1 Tax=Hypsibius exemplaris TaxID=2072580 RepID=A0A1W0WSZ6_HYPEX|nr:putative Regulator of nonsense transcripts 3A [Hypsibius exemplaris]